VARFCGPRCIY